MVNLAAGSRHCAAVTSSGLLYAWGEGRQGQLGIGDAKAHGSPQLVKGLQGRQIRQVACGGEHTISIESNGESYAWCAATSCHPPRLVRGHVLSPATSCHRHAM